jgi:hypothetical protein
VARKSRTPAPPRKVQAPQRRVDPKRPRPWSQNRGLLLVGAVAVAAVAAVLAVVLVTRGGGNGVAAPEVPNESQLVGLQTGPAPWNQGLDTLPDRLEPLGLNPDTNGHAGLVLHTHQHLDIFVNGKHESVPANIGIYDGQFLTELHTHDATGILHVESPKPRKFDLGQFFGVWGVRLNGDCVGGYCRPKMRWTLYVNGRPYSGDPRAIVLKEHQEIAFVIGKPPKKIPSKYTFPPGI